MQNGRRWRMYSAVLVVSALIAAAARAASGPPPDVLVIGGGATVGTAAAVPVYVRDTTGTLLGADSTFGIQLIQFRVIFSDPNLIVGCSNQTISQCEVTFVPAGVLAGKTASSLTQIRDSDSLTVRAVYDAATNPLTFTPSADAPGDLIGRLTIKFLEAQSDATPDLQVTLDPEVTKLEDVRPAGTDTENVANGWLRLIDGSVAFGAACSGLPPSMLFDWVGPVSGCTPSQSTCQLEEPVLFQALPDTAAQACDRFYWTFDDDTVGAGEHIEHAFSTQGFRRVALRSANDHGTEQTGASVSVATTTCTRVPSDATITITWQGSQGCSPTRACKPGEQIAFDAVPFGHTFSGCESFSWSFGDGSEPLNVVRPIKTYAAAGSYGLRLLLTSGGQRIAKVALLVVEGSGTVPGDCATPPQGSVSISWIGAEGCKPGVSCVIGEQIGFEAATLGHNFSGCETFLWSFGDGTTSTAKAPKKSYATAGSFPLRVTITTGSIATVFDGAEVQVAGEALCVPTGCTYTVPADGLIGIPIEFSGGVLPSACADEFPVTWTFGEGLPATGNVVQHTYDTPGVYTWTMTTEICTRNGTITIIKPTRRRSAPH
jgi:hypothetical protein